MTKELLVIVGPTASGKTGLAEAVAAQRRARLISADSQQVYRGMDIGTAKPSGPTRAAWALLDLVDPGQQFSAGDFCRLAAPLCQDAWSLGQLPVLCGGTGLYLKALLEGLAEVPAIPEQVRQALTRALASEGLEPLVQRLKRLDPVLAERTDLANPRRVLRGLEVYEATGLPLSQWQAKTTAPALLPERALWIGLDPGKEALEQRIEARTQALLDQGWLEEVGTLASRHGDAALQGCDAIGYAELLAQARGQLDPAQAREAIVRQTKQYARRQRTWFKALPQVHWQPDPASALAALQSLL